MRIPIPLLSLVVCVGATSLQPLLARRAPAIPAASIGREFQRRQITIGSVSSPPSQCASTCGPVNNEVSLGCPVTACCTTTFETQYYNCLECVGMALDATSYATAQNSLNLLYTTCVDMGFVLPPLALPGQTASGSNSSTSAHPTSTGSSTSASATALFPTGSSSVASSGASSRATGAAIGGRSRGVALIGVLFWLAGLW